ncbi:MAG: zinc-binding dehydrogenase [Chloroflexi bacterium]|nr:zinc-binding dehydrogenase [Chloroflexota bacterium]
MLTPCKEVAAMSLPKTCHAAVVTAFGEPLEIRELPVVQERDLEPGALLVRVDVASVCGSDVHQWEGITQALVPAELPIVLGHEMMGTVVAFGPGTREDSIGQPLKEGDRILWTHAFCGQCYECRVQHTPTLCRRKRQYMRLNCERFPYLTGGFAQYCYVFPASGRVRIPEGVPDGVASAASCALRTVMHAFDRLGRIEPHQRVVVQGAGPLGLFATSMASYAGVRELIVIGAPERRLALARRWGAQEVVSVEEFATAEQRVARVKELTGGLGGDVIMELSGASYAVAEGLEMLRPGGRYVVVGQLGGPLTPIQAALIVRKQATILGVQSADIGQFWKALNFVQRAGERFDFEAMLTTRYPLGQINEAIQSMRAFREIKPLILPWA